MVDLGIYGEPGVRPYRCVETMRALQRRVDLPSVWGVSYLTPDELHAARIVDFERYERARQEYHATGGFPPPGREGALDRPSGAPRGQDPPLAPLPLLRPPLAPKPHAYAALLLGAASKAVFGAWWQLRVLLARRRRQPGGP